MRWKAERSLLLRPTGLKAAAYRQETGKNVHNYCRVLLAAAGYA